MWTKQNAERRGWAGSTKKDGRGGELVSQNGVGGSRGAPSPAMADFSVMMEFTPEIGDCHSVRILWDIPQSRGMSWAAYGRDPARNEGLIKICA